MKIRKIILLLPLVVLFALPKEILAITTNTFQITTDSAQQKDAIVAKNKIAYTNFGGPNGIDIWLYNLETNENISLISKDGDQFLTGFDGNNLVYENIPIGETTPDVWLFKMNDNSDVLIAGGSAAQTSGVYNGRYVFYINGGACGEVHSFDTKKNIDTIISPTGCQPLRTTNNILIWPNGASGGTNIYGFKIKEEKLVDIVNEPGFQESPNIFNDEVVYLDYVTGSLGDYNAIKKKNLKTGEAKIIYQSTTSTLQSPSISNKYVVWSESTSQHINGIQGADLKSGEVFEIQPQGSHQNSHTTTSVWNNIASWMSFRTGNGDIYASSVIK